MVILVVLVALKVSRASGFGVGNAGGGGDGVGGREILVVVLVSLVVVVVVVVGGDGGVFCCSCYGIECVSRGPRVCPLVLFNDRWW